MGRKAKAAQNGKTRFLRSVLLPAVLLIAAAPAASAGTPDCLFSYQLGRRRAAELHSTRVWFWAGVCCSSTAVFWLLPREYRVDAVIPWRIGSLSEPGLYYLPAAPDDVEVDIACYRDGYRKVAKRKNEKAVLIGKGIGCLVLPFFWSLIIRY